MECLWLIGTEKSPTDLTEAGLVIIRIVPYKGTGTLKVEVKGSPSAVKAAHERGIVKFYEPKDTFTLST